jgi:hypothetical protein
LKDSNEFLDVAEAVLRVTPNQHGLEQLQWLPAIDWHDPEQLQMFAAITRAEGRTLAVTPALGAAMAAALCGTAQDVSLSWGCAVVVNSRADEWDVIGLPGSSSADTVVIDSGDGPLLLTSNLEREGLATSGMDPGIVHRAVVRRIDTTPLHAPDLVERRQLARSLGLVGIAHHIVGTCDATLQMSLDYASDRYQFRKPIGSNQAVQHLLAQAFARLSVLRSACEVVLQPETFEPRDTSVDAMLLKALAGRVMKEVMQATLQSLGAIGFTAEHAHQRYWRRAMTLDAVLGGHELLRHRLGADAIGHGVWRTPVFLA